ncbi:MAG: pyruvate, phosphate dikinase [Deltaproteobacteria bacterium]|nr:pyruvate, phosphate dikinase [Deltaproteobacteria bacterium]
MARKQYVYYFGKGETQGDATMKELLGGKGANLAEMTNLGIPVPAGFTISTELCTLYHRNNKKYPSELDKQVGAALRKVEKVMGAKFGDHENPLLLSVRSGARKSMPGMMETVLNIGLTSKTIPALIAKTNNPRFVYDSYRRLIMMYADVVMEKATGLEPKDGQEIRLQLEHELDRMKKERDAMQDTDLTVDDLKKLCEIFKKKIKEVLGKPFPDDPHKQLWGGIGAVFQSWNGKRAVSYRRIEGIPDEWGTAVNVQAMVFGNTGDKSATGVAFTRNPATGENKFYGEWLPNAQGEDVVAGIRTPYPMSKAVKTQDQAAVFSLEEAMPTAYKQLDSIRRRLERHYRDMQDIEFTIQDKNLWMLQTRTGKRNGLAAVQMAVDMCTEKLISKKEAVMRVEPHQIDELLHPMVDPVAETSTHPLAKGLPAGPGGATGRIVFTSDDAEAWSGKGEQVVLVRNETSPEDVHGMHAAEAILTAKGGMTSHAALVARGWGKCCIVGCSALDVSAAKKTLSVGGKTLKEGDWITLNGTAGNVYEGQLPLLPADPEKNETYKQLMRWADEVRTLGIRTNADTPKDAALARSFGAEGIGLCRTEHMFFSPERITAMREMIIAETEEERRTALAKLLPFQKQDFYGLLEAMQGLPVTIRLLDPPLHEFVNLNKDQIAELSIQLGVPKDKLEARIVQLHELNPMLGHRGCRLGITYPEISEMQARAIFEAAAELTKKKIKVFPEVMIPLVGSVKELANQREIVERVAKAVQKEMKVKFPYLIGTMIEIPRACVVADKIAEVAEFFSFGTNDLTQTTFGFSRDDVGGFLPEYLKRDILPNDPFQKLDQEGVGQLVEMGVTKGRYGRKDLKIGICGEHGGEPSSIEFCHRVGMNYVSCSPYRVPIARLAAAHAAVINGADKKPQKKVQKKVKK